MTKQWSTYSQIAEHAMFEGKCVEVNKYSVKRQDGSRLFNARSSPHGLVGFDLEFPGFDRKNDLHNAVSAALKAWPEDWPPKTLSNHVPSSAFMIFV